VIKTHFADTFGFRTTETQLSGTYLVTLKKQILLVQQNRCSLIRDNGLYER
jgi:hypothetical protein